LGQNSDTIQCPALTRGLKLSNQSNRRETKKQKVTEGKRKEKRKGANFFNTMHMARNLPDTIRLEKPISLKK